MNSFFDLHSSADYRNTNRPYYTGTWEYTTVSSDALIPFQVNSAGDSFTVTKITPSGAESSITSRFYNAFSSLSSWSYTGTGTHTSSGSTLLTWIPVDGDYWTSNNITLSAGDGVRITVDPSKFDSSEDIWVRFRKGTTILWTEGMDIFSGTKYFPISEDGSDYNIVLFDDGSSITMSGSNAPSIRPSTVMQSGTYWWYNGGTFSSLPASPEGIYRIKFTVRSNSFYSDWVDPCGFSGKVKIKLSSSYDYGGIKYVDGYEQYMYKNATVRRAPKAEIEITGDKLNGAIIEEKKTTAIRYKTTMKCTESEYEGLVHAMGGTLEITDETGKTYDAVNIELSDPTWYKANGLVELSFIDNNNISIFTRNNSNL